MMVRYTTTTGSSRNDSSVLLRVMMMRIIAAMTAVVVVNVVVVANSVTAFTPTTVSCVRRRNCHIVDDDVSSNTIPPQLRRRRQRRRRQRGLPICDHRRSCSPEGRETGRILILQQCQIDDPTTTTTTTTTIAAKHDDDDDEHDDDSKVLAAIPATPTTAVTTTIEATTTTTATATTTIGTILNTYWGPRITLSICAAIYSTNFALGSYMNDVLPASAVTACRMTLAALTLLPFLVQIQKKLLLRTILTGCCAAVGYVTQSMALMDTDPARVSFLGAATVIWLPILETTLDKVPMGIRDAPQTWIASLLCILGVGILELYDPSSSSMAAVAGATAATSGIHTGDILALFQAIGFGTGAYLSSKLVREEPDQILSITSVLITTTAVLSWIWCGVVGSTSSLLAVLQSDPIHTNMPLILAVVWTGVVSTSMNYVVENAALGRVPPAEASVLLASEPIWAAIVAAFLLGDTLGTNDYIGGSCIVAACLVNALLKPQDLWNVLAKTEDRTNDDDDHDDI